MGGSINLDGPLMKIGNRFADLMVLSVLTAICSIPFVTIGASYTAMHYILLKLYRNEEASVVKQFFHAFKSNFKKATVIWMIYVAAAVIITVNYFCIVKPIMDRNPLIIAALCVVAFLGIMSLNWSLILLSRYENSVKNTIKNGYGVGVSNFKKSLLMVVLLALPVYPVAVYPIAIPVMFLIGIALIGFIQTSVYSSIFQKLENLGGNSNANS